MPPAAPDLEPQQQEAPPLVKEALKRLETLNERISELLKAYGHRGGVTNDDAQRRSLSFLEMEVSAAIASLNQPALWDCGAYDDMKSWLHKLADRAECIELSQYDPSRHRLLRKAAQCFRRTSPRISTYEDAIMFYSMLEHPTRYKHLTTEATDERVEAAECFRELVEAESGGLHLVGMDSTMKKLLKWLATADQSVRVLSIVGPVGLGKTTLAVELYRRLRCQTRGRPALFNSQCYAQMSRGPDRNMLLLRQILSQIHGSAAPEMSTGHSRTMTLENDLELLVRDIREHLQDKRYLILIDDIWEASDWGKIKGAFPDNNCGSRILITTRVTSVAYEGCSGYYGLVHQMKPLNQVDSERLLLTRASGSVDACLPDDLDEILRRCEGVPLFITGTADWLKEQKQENNSAFHSVEQVCQIPKQFEQALFRAYNDLPCEPRLLSLYMSMFPHGYMFDKDRLVLKWIYEGLAWSRRNPHLLSPMILFIELSTIMSGNHDRQRAGELFSALVDRNIITRVVASNPDEAEACPWQVSHYMQQFLASISTEKGFAFTGTTPTSATAPEAWPRRVALHHPDPELTRLLQTVDLSQTRSLAVSGAVDQIPFGRFLYLVVLDLEGWDNLKDDDLLHICRNKMYFLRYLSIRKTQVTKLPSEISELVSLETLDASHTKINVLPSQVFGLRRLLDLDLRGTLTREIPEQIWRLHNLRRLLVGGDGTINSVQTATRIPEDICHVRWLWTLATVDLSQHPASFLNALGSLEVLRVLAITWSFHQCTDDAYCKELVSSIKNWKL